MKTGLKRKDDRPSFSNHAPPKRKKDDASELRNSVKAKLRALYDRTQATWPSSMKSPYGDTHRDEARKTIPRNSARSSARYFATEIPSAIETHDAHSSLTEAELLEMGNKNISSLVQSSSQISNVCILCSDYHYGPCAFLRCYRCYQVGHQSSECNVTHRETTALKAAFWRNYNDQMAGATQNKARATCFICGKKGESHLNCSKHPTEHYYGRRY